MKLFQRRKIEEIANDAGATSNDKYNSSTKLALSNSMEMAILTVVIFTEEQSEAIAQEIQTHLPKYLKWVRN